MYKKNHTTSTVAKHYDDLANIYDNEYANDLYLSEDKIVYSAVSKINGGKLLDVGCGTGNLLDNLNIPKEQYVGIDISEEMISVAKKKFPQFIFHQGGMNKLPFKDNEFDILTCMYGTISYSDDLRKVLKEFQRVTKPGGIILIMPYTLRVKYSIGLGSCLAGYETDVKLKFISSQYYEEIAKVGLKVKKVRGVNYTANFIYSLISKINYKNYLKSFLPGFKYLKLDYYLFNIFCRIGFNKFAGLGRHSMIYIINEKTTEQNSA